MMGDNRSEHSALTGGDHHVCNCEKPKVITVRFYFDGLDEDWRNLHGY